MVKKVKKKHYRPSGKKKEGNAIRSQAVKQLQVNLPLFRKLCILKGILPWEPKKKVKRNHHTYYHLKDMQYIQHDPLVEQLRGIKPYEKKVKKAEAKKSKYRAAILRQIVDRPLQPQELPPHLSQYIDPKEEGYVPDYALKIEQWKADEILRLPDFGKEDMENPESFADLEKAKEATKNDRKLKALHPEHFEGLKAEVKGVPPSSSISKSDNQISAKSTADREEMHPDFEQIVKNKDELELLLSMPRKKRHLVNFIMTGKKRKQDSVEVILERKLKQSQISRDH